MSQLIQLHSCQVVNITIDVPTPLLKSTEVSSGSSSSRNLKSEKAQELDDDEAIESVSQLMELQSCQVANVAIDYEGRSTTNEGNLWEGLQDDASTHLSLRRGRKLPNSNCDNNEEDDADSKMKCIKRVFLSTCCLVCKRNQREIDMSCDYEAYRLIPTISNLEGEEDDVPNDVHNPLLEGTEVRHNQNTIPSIWNLCCKKGLGTHFATFLSLPGLSRIVVFEASSSVRLFVRPSLIS